MVYLSCNGANSKEIESKLNKGLGNVHQWLTSNKLTLNGVKTEFIIIGSRQRVALIDESPIMSIGNKNFKCVPNKISLGLIIDEQLKWDNNNEVQCKKIS